MSENKAVYTTFSRQEYGQACAAMLDVVINSDHPGAENARQVLSILAAKAFDLQDELNQVTAAGYEATMLASNALNLEAQLTARLADAEKVAVAQGEIIARMSKLHAAEVTRWQSICLRQAEAVAWLFEVVRGPAEQERARQLFPDVLGEGVKNV